jgi:hypothetical protein
VSEEDAVGGGGGFSSAMLKKKVERVNQFEKESGGSIWIQSVVNVNIATSSP